MHKTSEKKHIAVLLDASYSMSGDEPLSRFKQGQKWIKNQNFSSKYDVSYFLFSDEVKKFPEEIFFTLKKPLPRATDIISSIEKIISQKDIDALVLISDGKDTVSNEDVSFIHQSNVPIYTVSIKKQRIRDISIKTSSEELILFADVPTEIDAEIRGINCFGKRVRVSLKKGNRSISSQTIRFSSKEETIPVIFKITPNQKGVITYSITVEKITGEETYVNNTISIRALVQKNKTRILYLCGNPGWEYRFLRETLKNDPTIDLVSFVILRKANTIQPFPERELSLIPFPAKNIFEKELFSFDLVIFENFSYQTIFTSSYLDMVKKFVEEKGKSLVVIGGENSFAEGGYTRTAMKDLLPVRMHTFEKLHNGLFRMRVTNFGHPLMLLDFDPKENEKIWQKLTPIDGIVSTSAKPDTEVLAVHPYLTDQNGEQYPVIVFAKQGKGRVLCTTNNTTWRWSFDPKRIGKTNYYRKFWLGAIRYLTEPEKFRDIILHIKPSHCAIGEAVRISLRLSGHAIPKTNLTAKFRITQPDKHDIILSSNLSLSGNGEKIAPLYFTPKQVGLHRVHAQLFSQENYQGSDSASFLIAIPRQEIYDLSSDPGFLKKISEKNNGKHFSSNDTLVLDKFKKKKRLISSKNELWKSTCLFISLILLLMLDWFIRRRKGLL